MALVHMDNRLVFLVQIQKDIHAKANHIGHVVYRQRPAGAGNRILDLLLVPLKIPEKFVILCIQKFPHVLLHPIQRKFRANNYFIVRP